MDYYNGSLFISDLEAKLKEKIEQMEVLKLIESNNIYHKVLINKLQSEIDELNMQITLLCENIFYGMFCENIFKDLS